MMDILTRIDLDGDGNPDIHQVISIISDTIENKYSTRCNNAGSEDFFCENIYKNLNNFNIKTLVYKLS